MFTLSKSNPEINITEGSYTNLGSIINDSGSRVLLICSLDSRDNESISLIKDQLTNNGLTFIQTSQSLSFINKGELNLLQERAETFSVNVVIAVGGFSQIMSGRYISQRLSLNYFEIPTENHIPFLLIPQSLYSNRVMDNFEKMFISPERVSLITYDPKLLRDKDNIELLTDAFSIILDLLQIHNEKENNIISINESKQLIQRILSDIEDENLSNENIINYSLTTALYQGAATESQLDLTLYSYLASSRFKSNVNLIKIKLLYWYAYDLDKELFERINEIMNKYNLPKRLSNLHISKYQLNEICQNNDFIQKYIDMAY